MEFCKCSVCGKIVAIVKDGVPDTCCCGKPMDRLVPNTSDGAGEKHVPVAEVKGSTLTVRVGAIEHPMADAHHIEWIAVETVSGNQRKVLDPLGKPEAEFALLPGDKVKTVYEYCNLHGLWKLDVNA
jgi:superoxide reductase